AQLRGGLGDDERTEKVVAELERLRHGEVARAAVTQVERLRLPATQTPYIHLRQGEVGDSLEQRHAPEDWDPVDLVTAERVDQPLVRHRLRSRLQRVELDD